MFTKTDIEKYFIAEKQESILFILIGITGILTAIVFLVLFKKSFYTGAALPAALIGLLMLVVGITIYRRSDEDRKRNVYAYDLNPTELRVKELPRMEKVMKNFLVYRYTEIFLLTVGVVLYIYFIRDWRYDFWRGLGLSLAIMAALALTADYFAEQRGKKYLIGLTAFVK
jgi:uncharacterized membrane protein HdeD (DUF308 family)